MVAKRLGFVGKPAYNSLMVLPPIPSSQPTTVSYVVYQRVQHALPDGTPDPKAPDNFYIRQTCTWFLTSDTDAITPDATGTKHVHHGGYRWRMFSKFKQQGRLRGGLHDRFTQVYPDGKAVMQTGSVSVPACDDAYPSGTGRHVGGVLRTIMERVETHTEGRNRATLIQRENWWAQVGGGMNGHDPFIPSLDAGVATEAIPSVLAAPPVFGYTPVSLPRDEDF